LNPDLTKVDLLVIGSGAGGMMAALTAAHAGLKVVLCESSNLLGGTSATSAGSIWVPCAPPIARGQQANSMENVWTYLRGELGEKIDELFMQAYLESGPQAIEFLEKNTEVQFVHLKNPDYHPQKPGGHSFGNNLSIMPIDGKLLGDWFDLLRPPRDIYTVLGGMMVSRRDVPLLLRPFSSWSNLKYVLKLVIPHLWCRLTYSRGTRLLIGNALIARMMLGLKKHNVKICVNHRLSQLIQAKNQKRVVGAQFDTPQGMIEIHARHGVVLATGGIPHDQVAQKELMPRFPHDLSLAFEGNSGQGIRCARSIGADIEADVMSPAYWSPASVLNSKKGEKVVWIHGHMDRGKPGIIAVNSEGHRFVNEADSYHDFVMAMYEKNKTPWTIPAWLICDHRFIKKYGLGLIKPLYTRLQPYIDVGYIKKSSSLSDLAMKISIDKNEFLQTIKTYNQDCLTGIDTQFGRGSNELNRFNGDPDEKPNPCLRAIETGPFYALAVYPCSIGTTVGLKTDTHSNVLDQKNQLLQGLYACGNDMNAVMRGTYPGPGITLGPAIVFAYRAIQQILKNNHSEHSS